MGAICSVFGKDKPSSPSTEPNEAKQQSEDTSQQDGKQFSTEDQSTSKTVSKRTDSSSPEIKIEISSESPEIQISPVTPPDDTSEQLTGEVVLREKRSSSTSQPYHKPRRLSHDPRLLEELPDLRHFSDDVRSLLLGRVHNIKVNPRVQEISVYVCCSYSDKLANSAFQKNVIPSLRQYTAELGYELNVVNLHYGVYGDCIDSHSYREICLGTLEELKKRGRLIVVVLHNEKVDDPMLPRVIEESDFDCAIHKIESVHERNHFNKWYLVDENATPPCYVLQPISEHIPDILSNVLTKRQEAMNKWQAESKKMVNILSNVLPEKKKANYLSIVLEEEIKRTVIENKDLVSRCIFLYPKQLSNGDIKDTSHLGLSVFSQLDNLLPEDKKISFDMVSDDEQGFEQPYLSAQKKLKQMIEEIVDEGNLETGSKSYKGMEEPLYQELLLQWVTNERHSQKFIGKQDILNNIRHYLEEQSSSPLIIHGPAGSGKTGIIAMTANLCSSWMPNTAVILRHVGISSESSTQEQLLRSISEHCCILIGEHVSLAFKSIQEHNASFEILLRKASVKHPLNIIIDGLDQVTNYSTRDLSWLSTKLPRLVKLILTLRDGSPELKQLRDIFPESCFLSLPPLTSIESMGIVDEILMAEKRLITDSQRGLIKTCLQGCPYPRYGRLLGYLAARWHSSKTPEQLKIANNVEGLIENKLNLLEAYVGEEVLSNIIGLLIATKHGLTDEELLDVLSCEDNVMKNIYFLENDSSIRFPRIVLHLIKHHLLPYLNIRVAGQRYVTTWKNQYYRHRCWEHNKKNNPDKYKNVLINYFHGKQDGGMKKVVEGKITRYILDQATMYGNHPNRRKLDELPFYCLDQNCPMARISYLFTPDWIVAKCRSSDPYEFLEDIGLYISHNTVDSEVYVLRDIVQLSSYALRYDSLQFYSQFYGRLKNIFAEDENIVKYPSLKVLYDLTVKPPIYSLLPLSPCLFQPIGSSRKDSTTSSSVLNFSNIYTMKDYPFHMVTISEERKEIMVWNIYQSVPVRTLQISQPPRDIKVIDNKRALVLCNRELVLYDLNRGRFLVRLKGIMNQKMPYYGIQDNKYVVALSRNRMYVNVMNLNTGDMETTFKVGEDRFLNSLLVSANGRICVCGDETQKPFPLLVWDLTERKLIYDFRIPQHEFVTHLTAISDDGRYLISVCRELPVDESSPDFIVVYDLESGTLFKKWKPEVNTCGIAISHLSDIVVNGLENGLVMIWDLATGAQKYVLKGHTAPIDQIRIDEKGTVCVTYDSLGRDRSLRMWDLIKGECLSVFMPDQSILCCQLSPNGKAVVMGLNYHQGIVTLLLCHKTSVEEEKPTETIFGDKEYANKVFLINETVKS